jgi:hypothetical protein
MTPSTLVPALTGPKLPPTTTAETVKVIDLQPIDLSPVPVVRDKHRVTLNLSVRDARNFDYLLRDVHAFSGERGEALRTVRRKLGAQLKRCPDPTQLPEPQNQYLIAANN